MAAVQKNIPKDALPAYVGDGVVFSMWAQQQTI